MWTHKIIFKEIKTQKEVKSFNITLKYSIAVEEKKTETKKT